MGYSGNSGGMSPSSAAMGQQGMYAGAGNGTAAAGMGPMGMQTPPVGVGMHHVRVPQYAGFVSKFRGSVAAVSLMSFSSFRTRVTFFGGSLSVCVPC